MKGNWVFVFILWSVGYCSAQYEPQFTQFMFNRYLFNPAYAGSEDALEISALHRSQYVSLASKSISTQGFTVNAPIRVASSGIGVVFVNDMIGFQRSTYVSLTYNYRKKFKWGNMGIGLSGGVIQASLDGSKIKTPDGSYEGGINHNDGILPTALQQGLSPDLSFGVYFNDKSYFAGVALNHIAFTTADLKGAGINTRISFSRNLAISGGYDFKVSQKLKIMPAAFIKTDFKNVQADISATFNILDNIITGFSFRGYTKKAVDALALFIGGKYKGFQLVYSYDINVSYLTKFNSGSHEISLNYRLPLKRKEVRGYFYHNPRFN